MPTKIYISSELIKKYIQHVYSYEGITYLSDSKLNESKLFTKEEIETLKGIEKDIIE